MARLISVKRMFSMTASIAAITVGLGACTPNTEIAPTVTAMESQPQAQSSSGAAGEAGKTPQKAFNRFPDIPVPTNADMDVKRTLIFGAGENWYGQLGLTTQHSTDAMFDFYKQELPSFGWREITSVRALLSVLTYQRQERVLSIRLEKATLGGTTVTLSVSPLGAGTPAPGNRVQ